MVISIWIWLIWREKSAKMHLTSNVSGEAGDEWSHDSKEDADR